MIHELRDIDVVTFNGREHTERSSCSGFADLKIVLHFDGPVLEADMVIRAEAEDVPLRIRPVVGTSQRANVGAFRVSARSDLDPRSADLTCVVVQLLDPAADLCVTNDALNGGLGSRRRPNRSRGCWDWSSIRGQLNKAVSTNDEP